MLFEAKLSGCAGEEPAHFRASHHRVLKWHFPVTHSRIASSWIFIRVTDVRKSGLEPLALPPGVGSKQHRD